MRVFYDVDGNVIGTFEGTNNVMEQQVSIEGAHSSDTISNDIPNPHYEAMKKNVGEISLIKETVITTEAILTDQQSSGQ